MTCPSWHRGCHALCANFVRTVCELCAYCVQTLCKLCANFVSTMETTAGQSGSQNVRKLHITAVDSMERNEAILTLLYKLMTPLTATRTVLLTCYVRYTEEMICPRICCSVSLDAIWFSSLFDGMGRSFNLKGVFGFFLLTKTVGTGEG